MSYDPNLAPAVEILRYDPFREWGARIGFMMGVAAGVAAECVLPRYFYDRRLDNCPIDMTHKDCVDLAEQSASGTAFITFGVTGMTAIFLTCVGKNVGAFCGGIYYKCQGRNILYVPDTQPTYYNPHSHTWPGQ